MIVWNAPCPSVRRRSSFRPRTLDSARRSGLQSLRGRSFRSGSRSSHASRFRPHPFRLRGIGRVSTRLPRPLHFGTPVLVTRENERPPRAGATRVICVRRQPDRLIAVIPLTLAEEVDQLRLGLTPTAFAHDLVDPAQEQRAPPESSGWGPFERRPRFRRPRPPVARPRSLRPEVG